MSNDTISRSHFDDRVRLAAGPDAEEEFSFDFLDGVKTVLYMLSTEPAVPQEMTAREFLRDFHRLCQSMRCDECPITHDGEPRTCAVLMGCFPDETIETVERWTQEHPERSEK